MSILEVNCDNLLNNPRCAHGPTLKFSRLVKGKVKKFYACSACRDRKDCPFFLWEDESISKSKLLSWEEVKNKSIPVIDHNNLQKRLKKFKSLKSQDRHFCLSCFDFILPNEGNIHNQHIIKNNITNDMLRHPSKLIAPSTKNKKEAQFWFSDNSKQFIINNIINQNTESILCIGAPTVFEVIRNKELNTLLLDIDYRYHWFYNSQEFCWFNMFNFHIFGNEELSKVLLHQNLQYTNIIVVIDPPFGARIEPLKKTIETFQNLTTSRIQIMLILPYFMESQVLVSFPDFKMLDYPIEYLNHSKFRNKLNNSSKKSSPVRIFTNIPPKSFVFPKNGFYFCKICEAWRSDTNIHCSFCETCPSKNGDVYNHCFICKKCSKQSWIHCNKCERCCLPEHSCEDSERPSFKKKNEESKRFGCYKKKINMSEEVKDSNVTENKKMTDEERIELASRLDKELDDYISGLEKKADKWKEGAEWHKEMENHPFFMKTLPTDGQVSPLIEGLQQLKYSTEENSPEELALSYKEDGNFNFKCKNYRMAIISYTEGLSQKISNPDLQAQLLNNRAAAQWELKNFRSCYNDCKAALKASPIYLKAEKRLAQVCYELGLFDECIQSCDKILGGAVDEKLSALRSKALKEKNVRDRNLRKEQVMKKKEEIKKANLKKMIGERGIKFFDKPCWVERETVFAHSVKIEGDHLVWPVVILYPEYKTSDVIENFHEDNTFQEQLDVIFEYPPEWDTEGKYNPASVVVHYEDVNGRIHMVNKDSTLGSVLKEPDFRVDGNTPSFIVHAYDTEAYKQFMSHYD